VQDFGFFPIHDSFGTHACDVEVMRKTVVRAFWEMHQGRSLDYWLSILEGPDGKLKKKSDVGVVKDKNLKEFKDKWNKSRYLIS
jgi:DNA-directed RNA polymerase